MLGESTPLYTSWRFSFSEDRKGAQILFQKGRLAYIFEKGLPAALFILLSMFLGLSAVWLPARPGLQVFLYAASATIGLTVFLTIARGMLRQRWCTLRLTEDAIEVPVGLLGAIKRIPLTSLTRVQYVAGFMDHIRFWSGNVSVSFILPRVRKYKAKAIAAYVRNYARRKTVDSEMIGVNSIGGGSLHQQ